MADDPKPDDEFKPDYESETHEVVSKYVGVCPFCQQGVRLEQVGKMGRLWHAMPWCKEFDELKDELAYLDAIVASRN